MCESKVSEEISGYLLGRVVHDQAASALEILVYLLA